MNDFILSNIETQLKMINAKLERIIEALEKQAAGGR